MNTPNGTYNEWVLKSNLVRDAGSPQDLVAVFRPINANNGTVNVPFAEGSEVAYVLCFQTTVYTDASGQTLIDFSNASDPIAGVLVFAKNQSKQTSFLKFT